MLENHVTLDIVLYCFKLVFDTVLYFCISLEYCGIEKRLLSLWLTFVLLSDYFQSMTFMAVLAS